MGLVDETTEQPCSVIPIHGASEKGDDAWTSNVDLSAVGTCFQCFIETKLRHGNAVNEIRLKSNVGRRDEAVSLLAQQQQSDAHSHRSSVPRDCPSEAFVEERSKSNIKSKRTLMKSSVKK
jgi:hypothetical protein